VPTSSLSATLSPSQVYADTVVRVSAMGLDPDEDPLAWTYDWRVNGVPVGDDSLETLAGAFGGGDQITVDLTADDGAGGTTSTSVGPITVLDSGPHTPAVRIVPERPGVGDALVCEVVAGGSDPDGDEVVYTFAWTRNGVATPAQGNTTHPGDTVLSAACLESAELQDVTVNALYWAVQ